MKNGVVYKRKLIISKTPDVTGKQNFGLYKGGRVLKNIDNNILYYSPINSENQIQNPVVNNENIIRNQNEQNYVQINNLNNNINNVRIREKSKLNSDGKIYNIKPVKYDVNNNYFNYTIENNKKQNQIIITNQNQNLNGVIYNPVNVNEINNIPLKNIIILNPGLNQQSLYRQNYIPTLQIQPQIIPIKKNNMLNGFNTPIKNNININFINQQGFIPIQKEIIFQPLTERKNKDDSVINYNPYLACDEEETLPNTQNQNANIISPVKTNNINNIYNPYQSPLNNNNTQNTQKNNYIDYNSPNKNIVQFPQYCNTEQPKYKLPSIRLTQSFQDLLNTPEEYQEEYKEGNNNELNNNINNNQYLNTTPIKMVKNIQNNNKTLEKCYSTFTLPINTNINSIPKLAKNLFGKGTSIKSFSHLCRGGKEEGEIPKINQDTYIALPNINNIKDFSIFAVLDGHGPEGHKISKYASQLIIKNILSHPLINSVQDIETIYFNLKNNNYQIIRQAFISTDHQILNSHINVQHSGTTCLLVIIIGIHLIAANVGDSRGVVAFNQNNDPNLSKLKVSPLSVDYKLEIPKERNRVTQKGGIVKQLKDSMGNGAGPFRVFVRGKDYPGLAMSRSIGDSIAKSIGVISEPGLVEYLINDTTKFVVLASDGVWEFLDNEKVKNIGKTYYLNSNAKALCEELYSSSLIEWKINDSIVDDITVIVIYF